MKILFVSSRNHLNAKIPGGVQVCTHEYKALLENAAFTVEIFPIDYTKSIWKRLLMKLGFEVYNRFDNEEIAKRISQYIKEKEISIIALNQVNLFGLAPHLKKEFGSAIKILILSHGNFSGDFLHEITRERKTAFQKVKDIIRLGYAVYLESKNFIYAVDAVFCLSETEKEINNWLGAPKNIFIPRTFNPDFLDWKPDLNRIGFVGTLNHPPNLIGLEKLLKAFKDIAPKDLKLRIVGSPQQIGKRLEEDYHFVEYVGYLSDEDLLEEASTWAFFLNPIFWYSRGASTKLAQGINWGIPVVSTLAGNRGYKWKEGNILIADNPQHMAQLIIQNLNKEGVFKLSKEIKKVAHSGLTAGELSQLVHSAIN